MKTIDNKYITKPGKSYKQVGFNDVKRLYHNGNWQFVVQKQELQFIPHLATAVA